LPIETDPPPLAGPHQHPGTSAEPGEEIRELAHQEALSTALEQLALVDEEVTTQNAELISVRDALEHERARYQELFELAPDPYLLTDEHGLICEANRAAARLLGIDRKFLTGKPLQVFVPARERYDFRVRVVELLARTGPVEWRLRILPRDGPPRHVSAAVATVCNRHGLLTGLRWSIRDITERVLEEERLRDLNAELERRVAERTEALEIANQSKDALLERERSAREDAEEANRSKDEFLATLSHELRTPLNVVLGLAFRLRGGSFGKNDHEKALETIERNARELSHLVEDLLDTARIASGRLSLTLQVVELSPIVQGAIDSVEATAEARGIRIDARLTDGPRLKGDPERLRQITWNLLTNALKFTPEGGAISVSTTGDGNHASLVISDTGVGIKPPVMPHIFERFWQGEPSATRNPGGLGLGLAIVKHLVELHGGAIEARSEGQNRGATFTVMLPLYHEAGIAVDQELAGN